MKKLILSILFSFSFIFSAEAQVSPKAKAFLTMVGYGAAGGALLGGASTAFGTSGRAIAQGASLGLYAGIIFGSYVLISHHNRRYGQYDDRSSPYKDSPDMYEDDYESEDGGASGEAQDGFFDRIRPLQTGGKVPPIYVPVLHLNF